MKKIGTLILLMWSLVVYNQEYNRLSISIGLDPKIATIGSDNQYTTHSSIFNFIAKVDFTDKFNNILNVGVEYAGLESYYLGVFVAGGKGFNLTNDGRLKGIAQVEVGTLWRDQTIFGADAQYHSNPGWLYYGGNLSLRYYFYKDIAVEGTASLKRAPDLPARGFRYEAYISITIPILKTK